MQKALLQQGIGLLFALVFAVGGWLAGFSPLLAAADAWWQTRHWVTVKATVTQVELHSQHSRKPDAHELSATYEYSYEGVHYAAQRIGLQDNHSSSDDWQRQWHDTLHQAMVSGLAITAWINPHDPQQALLDRTIRWRTLLFSLPFAILFPMFALLCLWLSWRAGRSNADPTLAATRTRRLQPARGGPLLLFCFGLGFVVLGGSVAAIAIPPGLTPHPSWLALLFVAVGLGAWWLAIREWRSRLRAGEVSIRLETAAPRVGGTLRGRLDFAGLAPQTTYHLSLVCEHVNRHGDSAHQRTIWTDAVTLHPHQGDSAFTFTLPAHLPASTPTTLISHAQDRWRLLLQAPDMSDPLGFDVHVNAAMSAPTLAPVAATDTAIMPAPAVRHAAHSPGGSTADAATIEDEPGYLRIVLDGRRSRRDTLPTLLFALLIGALGGLIFATMTRAFGLLILLLAALIVHAALRAFFDEQSLTLRAGRIQLTRRTLFRTRQIELAAQGIDHLIALPEQSSQISARPDFQNFTLYALAGNSALHVLFSNVIGTRLAETLMQRIQARLTPAAEVADIRMVEQNRLTLARHPARNVPWWQRHLLKLVFAVMVLTAISMFSDLWMPTQSEQPRPRIEASAEAWFAAMDANRLDDLQDIAKLGVPIDIQAANGSSALALACAKGNLPIVQWLLEAGADLHQRNSQPDNNNYLSTPLMRAGYGANPQVVELLLARGARIDDKDAVQRTPLHFMAWGGCGECIRVLVKRGAALEARATGSRGETPLMAAAGGGHIEAVKTLLTLGADLNARDDYGYDAIGWAEFHKRPEIIEYLKSRQGRAAEHRQSAS